jgi:hypothetical protein
MAHMFDQAPYSTPSRAGPSSTAAGYAYGGPSPSVGAGGSADPLQFYSSTPGGGGVYAATGFVEGNVGAGGGAGGQMQGGFWSAFTPNGYPDEPPLLEGAVALSLSASFA